MWPAKFQDLELYRNLSVFANSARHPEFMNMFMDLKYNGLRDICQLSAYNLHELWRFKVSKTLQLHDFIHDYIPASSFAISHFWLVGSNSIGNIWLVAWSAYVRALNFLR